MTLEDALYVCRNMKARSLASIEGVRFTYDPQEFAMERFSTDGIKLAAIADDGIPVGVGGIELSSPGVWTGWMGGTDRWTECGQEIFWHAKKLVRRLLSEKTACHRIQAFCVGDDDGASRYLELIGFKLEGISRKLRKDGGDMCTYSIVSDDLRGAS